MKQCISDHSYQLSPIFEFAETFVSFLFSPSLSLSLRESIRICIIHTRTVYDIK